MKYRIDTKKFKAKPTIEYAAQRKKEATDFIEAIKNCSETVLTSNDIESVKLLFEKSIPPRLIITYKDKKIEKIDGFDEVTKYLLNVKNNE